MTTEQDECDEMVLAAIITGARDSGRRVLRGSFGVLGSDPDGSCCAIGAGCLYAGISHVKRSGREDGINGNWELGPVEAFAQAHGVSLDFSCGVSDGFEDIARPRHNWAYGALDGNVEDYARGVDVGRAAYAALVEDVS